MRKPLKPRHAASSASDRRAGRDAGTDATDATDDGALFRAALDGVRRLPEAPPPPRKPPPRPSTRMAERDEAEARSEFERLMATDRIEVGDVLAWRRDGVPPHVLRRLSRGEYAAGDELDLHGTDAATAERLLREFLRATRDAGAGCVRIVHGKGLRSDSGVPVLKNLVDRVLRQRADVLAFHSAPVAQGGTGAVLVLQARRRS